MAWTPNQKVTINFNRYVFFNSLAGSPLGAAASAHFKNNLDAAITLKAAQTEEGLEYIRNFLDAIKQLAQRQRANELKFLQANKDNIDSNKYLKNGNFDYILFIKDLNEAKESISEFQASLSTFEKEIQASNNIFNNMYQYLIENDKEHPDRNGKNQGVVAAELYLNHRRNDYARMMTSIGETINEKIPETINTQYVDPFLRFLGNASRSADLINILSTIINNINPSVDALKSSLIRMFLKQFKTGGENRIEEILQGTLHTAVYQELIEGLNTDYANIASSKSGSIDTLQKWADDILNAKTGVGIANRVLSQTMRQQINNLNKRTGIGKKIFDTMIQFYDEIDHPEKYNNISSAKAKEKFSKVIYKYIQDQKKKEEDLAKQANNAALQTKDAILSRIRQHIFKKNKTMPNILNILSSIFFIDKIDKSDMGQLNAALREDLTQNLSKPNLPGKKIQLKNDLSITYHLNPIDTAQLTTGNAPLDKLVKDTVTLFDQHGKRFLQTYAEKAKRETNVRAAAQAWFEVVEEEQKYKRDVLSKLKNGQLEKNFNSLLETLFTSISVKEYQFYNNQYGFGAGTLGSGGGLVVNAVPNLMAMLDLGGISNGDVESIIGALLNSFPDSILDSNITDNIKNFLLTGAAMMLFDDGFTAGKTFLDQVSKQFGQSAIPGTMHLLVLNNIYIPQSYLLMNIYENLVAVYADLNNNFKAIEKRQTSSKVKSSLVLNNQISYSDLFSVYRDQTSMQQKWDDMSDLATSTVSISFFFMAGMLDILESLQSAFTVN